MRLIHRIAVNIRPTEREEYRQYGIEPGSGILTVFLVGEDDPRLNAILDLVRRFNSGSSCDIVHTEYSASEMLSAHYYGVDPSWHLGYPQPERNFGYLEATYDLAQFCRACGVGKRQNAPFRLKKEPVWVGNRLLFQLNWVYGEYFCRTDVWEKYFEPFGIGYRQVVLNKNGAVIDSVVQLDIPIEVDVDMTAQSYEICEKCNSKKYNPGIVGFYPKPERTEAAVFRSRSYYGSGGSAFQRVFVSKEVFLPIHIDGLKGIEFSPCKS
jgi:hypothetical protein